MTEQEKAVLRENIARVKDRAAEAAIRAGRRPEEITLVAATKMNNAERVRFAVENGIAVCGENRVQELLEKYELSAYGSADLQFIGTLQTNKVKYIIDKVKMIHSVDSMKLAEEISKRAKQANVNMDILVEVNMAGEESKFGVSPKETLSLIQNIAFLDNISVKGLMTVAPFVDNPEENRDCFRRMKQLLVDINSEKIDNVHMNVLSMGMSNDFEVAIEEGATIVRVGTNIFGKRVYPQK